MGICPHCETALLTVDIEAVTLSATNMSSHKGLTYSCTHCQKILGVSVNPSAEETALAESLG
jgi:RNase P subunit RPR2